MIVQTQTGRSGEVDIWATGIGVKIIGSNMYFYFCSRALL
jgi:hypothetical protein